jgi:hypothetical protein
MLQLSKEPPMTDAERIADGWIAHDGGPCPVNPGSNVSVMFRDGVTYHEPERASGIFWPTEREPHPHDIIAYRPEQANAK